MGSRFGARSLSSLVLGIFSSPPFSYDLIHCLMAAFLCTPCYLRSGQEPVQVRPRYAHLFRKLPLRYLVYVHLRHDLTSPSLSQFSTSSLCIFRLQ